MTCEGLLNRVFHTALKLNGDGQPEVRRWKILGIGYIWPLNKAIAVYVHKFLGNDTRPHHAHASRFVSLGLKGRYVEHVFLEGIDGPVSVEWNAPWIRTWKMRTHRISLRPNEVCWTLVVALLNRHGNHV